MKRLLAVLLFAVAVTIGVWAVDLLLHPAPPAARHLLVISLDTTRADALGVYGNAQAHTPSLDTLAQTSMVFERHYSAAPSTLASHTSLMTGLHPHSHGTGSNSFRVRGENRMLAEVLREAGWHTAAFLGAMPLATHSDFPQGFDHVDEAFVTRRNETGGQPERPGPEVVASVLSWLDDHPPGEDPLFLFVHLFDAHAPYAAPADHLARFDLTPEQPELGTMRSIDRVRRRLKAKEPGARADALTLRRLYAAGISWTDETVGTLLHGLTERGLLDEMLVVVTADHGETFAEHDEIFDHGATVYDETIRTPLVVRFPGGWGGGQRLTSVVSNVDIFPTVLELLHLPGPVTEGHSLVPVMRGSILAWDHAAFSEATKSPHAPRDWLNTAAPKAMVSGPMTLLWSPSGERSELYNVRTDPAQQHDLSADRPPVVRALREDLQGWAKAADPPRAKEIVAEDIRTQLAALGYSE